jgi:hypothetical protein
VVAPFVLDWASHAGGRGDVAGDTETVMMKHVRAVHGAALAGVLSLLSAASANAQITRVESGRHTVSVNLGYFTARGDQNEVENWQADWVRQRFVIDPNEIEAGRSRGDVLLADLFDFDAEPLQFNLKDFNGPTISGEWNYALSDYLEAGVGVGFYQQTVHSVYLDAVNEVDGSEIEQELRLRVVPFSATVKFLPIGRGKVEPYVGGGLGLFRWSYSEVGQFVDTFDYSLFRARYEADGLAAGPIVLGGVRFPFSDVWLGGVELRYQHADGKIDRQETELLGDKMDLGGWSANFGVHLRF